MIVACPACATRYDFPASRFTGSGTMVRCVECGHNWIESRPIEIIDLSPRSLSPPASVPAVIATPEPDADREVRRLTEAARIAREEYSAQKQHRRKRLLGWAGFAAGAGRARGDRSMISTGRLSIQLWPHSTQRTMVPLAVKREAGKS
jgi:predicted Zn finger-like uncharacterized protein